MLWLNAKHFVLIDDVAYVGVHPADVNFNAGNSEFLPVSFNVLSYLFCSCAFEYFVARTSECML